MKANRIMVIFQNTVFCPFDVVSLCLKFCKYCMPPSLDFLFVQLKIHNEVLPQNKNQAKLPKINIGVLHQAYKA